MYSYPTVEAVLMSLFFVTEHTQLAFRARLRNLQRLGFRHEAAGRGKRIKYSKDDICDLALALSLNDLGLDPHQIVFGLWPGVTKDIKKDMYCIYIPNSLVKARGKVEFIKKKALNEIVQAIPRLSIVDIDVMRERISERLAIKEAAGVDS